MLNEECCLCGLENETLPHLFFGCGFSSCVMNEVAIWLQCGRFPLAHNRWRAWLGYSGTYRSFKRDVVRAASAAGIYYIWQERNMHRHGGEA